MPEDMKTDRVVMLGCVFFTISVILMFVFGENSAIQFVGPQNTVSILADLTFDSTSTISKVDAPAHPAETEVDKNARTKYLQKLKYGIKSINISNEDENVCKGVKNENAYCKKRVPDSIIIGTRKSGTRALLWFLAIHPRIRSVGPELHFFDRYYDKGLQWYKSKMPFASQNDVVIEKTPKYFITNLAPERIHQINPNTKLILIVKDPVQRGISDYNQQMVKHNFSLPPFEKYIFHYNGSQEGCPQQEASDGFFSVSKAAEKRIFKGKTFSCKGRYTFEPSLYAKHFYRWLKVFPRKQILVVNGDDIIRNPVPALNEIEAFLGIENVISYDHIVFCKEKGFFCKRNVNLAKGKNLPRVEIKCLNGHKGRESPPVQETTIKQLKEYFQKLNVKFFKLISKRFLWGGYPKYVMEPHMS